MGDMRKYKQLITSVEPNTPAEKHSLVAGEYLLAVNDEPVIDLIDYLALTSASKLKLSVEGVDGGIHDVVIHKGIGQHLGLGFETSLMSPMRVCHNKCVFCFIDQMPDMTRSTLHVKDDDWRMSFIMGNYVSLTNVDETEFLRILKRRIDPLYVSVHAMNPRLRVNMMRNPNAGLLPERLLRLHDEGLSFHAQIVLCPELNDGDELIYSINELVKLAPSMKSLAIVPVGLTGSRKGLYPLRSFTKDEARKTIELITPIQSRLRAEYGEALVYLSDEWYLMADMELPAYEDYDGFPQIENGVGLLRLFERDFVDSLSVLHVRGEKKVFELAGGVIGNRFFSTLYERLLPYGVELLTHPVENRFFGGNVHVGGLVTGIDLVCQLKGSLTTDTLLIPSNMLREREDVFLDGMTAADVEKELGVRIRPFADANALISILDRE